MDKIKKLLLYLKEFPMKKSIYLLFALFMLSMVSCNYATNAKGKTMTDDPVAKENKSLVQEKKYVSNKEYWSVSLTNRLEDTRTKEDLMINAPKKICIVNRVIFNGLSMVSSKSLKGIPYTLE
jgi:lipoprotein